VSWNCWAGGWLGWLAGFGASKKEKSISPDEVGVFCCGCAGLAAAGGWSKASKEKSLEEDLDCWGCWALVAGAVEGAVDPKKSKGSEKNENSQK